MSKEKNKLNPISAAAWNNVAMASVDQLSMLIIFKANASKPTACAWLTSSAASLAVIPPTYSH
jgi:hypothetical protein